MAIAVSHKLFSINSCSCSSFQLTNPSLNKPQSLSITFHSSIRTKTVTKSSSLRDDTSTVTTSSPRKAADRSLTRKLVHNAPGPPGPPPRPPSSSFLALLVRRLRDGIKVDELAMEILSIALPAALALAADPVASLVDTAFIGHIGSVELAAVGVSVSVFNLVSKLFNVPLLNITTSFVAEEQALLVSTDCVEERHGKKVLPSVSTSLLLAAGVGIAETIALSVGSSFLMNIMGFTNASTS